RHFRSLDRAYLAEFRSALQRSRAEVVNVAVDGDHSPYSPDAGERETAVRFSKDWIDAAAALGAPGIRTNIPPVGNAPPNLDLLAERLRQVAAYGASKNVVVSLENDNPVSEDPLVLVKVIEKVGSPWLRALPDFANSLTTFDEDHAYSGLDALFAHAYC